MRNIYKKLCVTIALLTVMIPSVTIGVYAEDNSHNSGYIPDDTERIIDDNYDGKNMDGITVHRLDEIEEVIGKSGLFKAGNGDICLLVELFGDLSGDLVQLHAVQLALGKAVREHSEEIAHAHGRLQNVAACKAHPFQSCVHFPNDNRGGIVGV